MLDRLSLKEGSLVLVPQGRALKMIAGFDGDKAILWINGSERRLYGRSPDENAKLWDGVEDLREKARAAGFDFREAEDFEEDFSSSLLALNEVHLPFSDGAFAARLLSLIGRKRRFRRGDIALRDLRDLLGGARLVKSAAEIEAMREAARRSAEAHAEIMRIDWTGQREKDIAMRFDLELRRRGIDRTAYETIVGAGDRSMILHARASERVIKASDFVLMDAGGMWEGLCADITRSFPAGASFTDAQRRLYSIVLEAQKKIIALVKPGRSLDELHQSAEECLLEGLRREGWLRHDEQIDLWYPHQTSHWLGRDVHDACPYREADGSPIRLAAGMTFTIEPGLYMRGPEAPAEVRGLGIRIEDNVVVTESGCEVLTGAAPKEIQEIEEARAEALGKGV